ncbi:MAG: ATP-dependent Clp protease proteolytic subunit [Caldimicrobium sp.]|nr:ATP-dependent Clp protease proteolytic subunit [Caldimicrobium sp.]MCX7874092.1 ATP-dependent Clp protease proteolytic subunit [Caldimicrobium sp.]MDW8093773.1 ATP-dependent Clp protease proteolytic subunit [Caldimicrobium sp.]
MGGFELLFILLLALAMQPFLRQKFLEMARAKMIEKIEAQRGSRVILLVHRQETMSFLGFPLMRYIDINDSEEVIRAIHLTDKDVPIDIILHTPGGLVLAALQIALAIKKHPAKVTAFIPHYAMSGGTLIALACDEIVMDEHAVLGPVDPQIEGYPAASILRLLKRKPLDKIEDRTLILADVAEMALRQMKDNLRLILNERLSEEKIEELAEILSQGYFTHDYPITFEEAKRLGLPVSKEMPIEIYQLMKLFPQPTRSFPSVEYLPLPKKKIERA